MAEITDNLRPWGKRPKSHARRRERCRIGAEDGAGRGIARYRHDRRRRQVPSTARQTQKTAATCGRGRPSKFTDALATEICERLGKGEPLAVICRDANMPKVQTVSDWRNRNEGFSVSTARAREEGFDAIAAECLRIADTPLVGAKIKKSDGGIEETCEDMLGHRKLQIETRLKQLAKWDPKRYGDKIDVNASHSGEIHIVIGGDGCAAEFNESTSFGFLNYLGKTFDPFGKKPPCGEPCNRTG